MGAAEIPKIPFLIEHILQEMSPALFPLLGVSPALSPLFGVVLGCPCWLWVLGWTPEGWGWQGWRGWKCSWFPPCCSPAWKRHTELLRGIPAPPRLSSAPRSVCPIPCCQSKVRDGSRDAAHSPTRLSFSSLSNSPGEKRSREVAERNRRDSEPEERPKVNPKLQQRRRTLFSFSYRTRAGGTQQSPGIEGKSMGIPAPARGSASPGRMSAPFC